MAKLQRVPTGFLELLGIKASGQSIADAAEFLQPTIAMVDFYGSILWGGEQGSAAAGPPPLTVTLTVPPQEIWFLKGMAAILNVPAGTTRLHARMAIAPIASPGMVVEALNAEFTASAAQLTFNYAWQPPSPWILRPGSTVNSTISEIEPGPNADLNFLTAMFYRVPI